MDDVSAIREQTEKMAKLVGAVRREQFGKPTPCSGFDVRALINHMCMGNHFLAKVVDGEKVLPDYETDFVGDDHLAAYERSKDDVLRAFGAPDVLERTVPFPGVDIPAPLALGFGMMEAIVHRWDLAEAVGLDPEIDPDVAAMALERVRPMIPDELRAGAPDLTSASVPFGPPVEVPDTASPVDQLLAFLGRTP